MDNLISLTFTVLLIGRVKSELLEACSPEVLTAECDPGHALLLKRAEYGRLHLGRCVQKDYGHIGCSSNVRDHIDPLCSGRQSCALDVYKTLYEHRPPACSELEAFLVIDYDCVPVVPLTRQRCAGGTVTVDVSDGYLPSSYSEGDINAIERFGCSVELVAKRGQIWNLTLLDFGRADDQTISSEDEMAGKVENTRCTQYAVVKETAENTNSICGPSETREKNIYLSNSNVIKIDMNLNIESTFYLIAFKAMGCVLPDNPNIVRVGLERNKHTFHCNMTGERWTLECQGSAWKGEHKACRTDPTTSEFRTRTRDWNSTTGLLIVVGLGLVLGVVIGTTLLGLVICYYKRRYRRPPAVQEVYTGPTYGSGQQKMNTTPSVYKTYGKNPQRPPMGTSSSVEYGRRHLPSTDSYKYPYQSCQAGGQFQPARMPLDHVLDVQNRAHASPEEDMMSHMTVTGPASIIQYGGCKPASDTSSSSDHVYEIPS